MIGEAELRRLAARWNVDPMVVDLDYSLGWYIAALYRANEIDNRLCFKGGTCLRKCHFADYRFSEDLDFTATTTITPDRLLEWNERTSHPLGCRSKWSRLPGFHSAPGDSPGRVWERDIPGEGLLP